MIGASQGIGRAIAIGWLQAGAHRAKAKSRSAAALRSLR